MIIPSTVSRINANSAKINTLLKSIGHEVNEISAAFGEICRRIKDARIADLKLENENLKKQIEERSKELRDIRRAKGIPQISIPTLKSSEPSTSNEPVTVASDSQSTPTVSDGFSKPDPSSDKKNQKPDKQNQPKEKKAAKPTVQTEKEEEPHIGRLDIRVGKIVNVEKHPDADSLYVEKVDIGEEKHRTIISGLVNHIPIEEMKDRIALFLVNLKPAKMRGIVSEGMIMCANHDGKVEVLVPPQGVQPGEFVTVDGYERKPDTQLNPKKKIFELVQVDLKTNDKREATYKGIPWNVAGKGPAISSTLTNAIIK